MSQVKMIKRKASRSLLYSTKLPFRSLGEVPQDCQKIHMCESSIVFIKNRKTLSPWVLSSHSSEFDGGSILGQSLFPKP